MTESPRDNRLLVWLGVAGVVVFAVAIITGQFLDATPGSLADWLAAVSTLAALLAASYAAIQTGRTLALEQQRDRKRDSEDVDRRTREDRAEQADRVAAWPQRVTASDLYETEQPSHRQQVVAAHTAGWGSVVANRSELAIYDVSVTVYGPEGSPRYTEGRATLSPGEVFMKWPGDVIRQLEPLLDADGDAIMRDEGDNGGGYAFGVAVSFRDTAGRQWTRDRHGQLEYRGRMHFVDVTDTIAITSTASGEVTPGPADGVA